MDRSFLFLKCLNPDATKHCFSAGLERFIFIEPHKTQTDFLWQSPWGSIPLQTAPFHFLHLQPTHPIALDDFGHFQWETKSEGYEPGPILWGVGQKVLWIDLFLKAKPLLQIEALSDKMTAAGEKKFQDLTLSLGRASQDKDKESPIEWTKKLYLQSLQKLKFELQALTHNNNIENIHYCGGLFDKDMFKI